MSSVRSERGKVENLDDEDGKEESNLSRSGRLRWRSESISHSRSYSRSRSRSRHRSRHRYRIRLHRGRSSKRSAERNKHKKHDEKKHKRKKNKLKGTTKNKTGVGGVRLDSIQINIQSKELQTRCWVAEPTVEKYSFQQVDTYKSNSGLATIMYLSATSQTSLSAVARFDEPSILCRVEIPETAIGSPRSDASKDRRKAEQKLWFDSIDIEVNSRLIAVKSPFHPTQTVEQFQNKRIEHGAFVVKLTNTNSCWFCYVNTTNAEKDAKDKSWQDPIPYFDLDSDRFEDPLCPKVRVYVTNMFGINPTNIESQLKSVDFGDFFDEYAGFVRNGMNWVLSEEGKQTFVQSFRERCSSLIDLNTLPYNLPDIVGEVVISQEQAWIDGF